MTEINQAQEFRTTAKNASIIGSTALLGAGIGFFLQLAIAYYFGAGEATDAYFMAQSTSELLSKLLLGGSIASVFIPMFIHAMKKEGQEMAWKQALNIFHIVGLLFLICIGVLAIGAKPFIEAIAPGFSEETSLLTIALLRILLPSFFFLFLVDMGTAMLHSLQAFTYPALLRLIAPTISLIALIVLATPLGIYALAVGALVGSCLQVSIIFYGLYKRGFRYHLVFKPFDSSFKKLILLVYPFIGSMLVTQAAGIVYRILVSGLSSGSLASLKFAEKITQLITIVFLTSVTSVMYPILSEKASRSDTFGMRQTVAQAIRFIVFVSVPIVIGIALLRAPLVSLIFEHGLFTATNSAQTSTALLYLVIGLTTNGISAVLGYTVLALQRTKLSVAVTIASQIAAILLFFILVPPMGHAGLALASSLVPLVSAALYFFYLRRLIPGLGYIFWHSTYGKIGALSVFLSITVIGVLRIMQTILFESSAYDHIVRDIIMVSVPALTGAAVYSIGAYMLHIPEIHELTTLLKKKIGKSGAGKEELSSSI